MFYISHTVIPYSICLSQYDVFHMSCPPSASMFLQITLSHSSLTAESYSIVYVYYISFINSFADGPLGCFHVLDIVNSAAMNPEVHVSF